MLNTLSPGATVLHSVCGAWLTHKYNLLSAGFSEVEISGHGHHFNSIHKRVRIWMGCVWSEDGVPVCSIGVERSVEILKECEALGFDREEGVITVKASVRSRVEEETNKFSANCDREGVTEFRVRQASTGIWNFVRRSLCGWLSNDGFCVLKT
ncbi:hypothetical protein Ahy_B10g105731 isoform G [Arachis hypogaea]|uniref:Uncharacterized protein n=1 Tax=Arachis hypogaea TaxID=3818 RepID=A0A444X8Q0_ARAHY|nr:hypothetical protein Ahy_B10g105731 isoform G [Arachis hypogaea]